MRNRTLHYTGYVAKVSDETVETIVTLRKEGVTYKDIAERLGLATSTVRHHHSAAVKRAETQTAPPDAATINPTEQTEITLRELVCVYAALIPDLARRLHNYVCEDRAASEVKALETALAIAQDKMTKAESDLATLEAKKATDNVTEPDWGHDELDMPDNVVKLNGKKTG